MLVVTNATGPSKLFIAMDGMYAGFAGALTGLYRIVEQHYSTFTAHLAAQGRELPGYVQREFDDYLKCGRLEHGLTYRMY